MYRFTQRLTYSNVLASLSLFLALGGGAYAAGTQGAASKTGPRVTSIAVAEMIPGTLVARAGNVRLEMAGGYGLRVRNDSAAPAHYACHGLHGVIADAVLTPSGVLTAGEVRNIVSDFAEPPLLTCQIADRQAGTVTEAIIGQSVGSYGVYAGHAISDGSQQ
jgi:hypothetical protein